MAHQAHFRRVHAERQAADIRVAHDPTMNDPRVTGLDKVFRADRLRNSAPIARDAECKWSQSERVLREAAANSGPDDLRFGKR